MKNAYFIEKKLENVGYPILGTYQQVNPLVQDFLFDLLDSYVEKYVEMDLIKFSCY